MSALIKLLETTNELVKVKIELIDQYRAQMESFIKLGHSTGATKNTISSGVQKFRELIDYEIKQIETMHREADAAIQIYLAKVGNAGKENIVYTSHDPLKKPMPRNHGLDHTDMTQSSRYGVTMIVEPVVQKRA